MPRALHRPFGKALVPLVGLALLVACAPSAGPAAVKPQQSPVSSAPVIGVVATSKTAPLALRKQPTTASTRLARIPHGTRLILTCRTDGESINNRGSRTSVWDKVTYQGKTGYVSAAYVTGGDSPAIPDCSGAAGGPSASPTVTTREGIEARIIDIARSQLKVKETATDCNPYGACVPWSSLFVTWVWRRAGNEVPAFTFTGDLYAWGQKHDRSHPGLDGVGPGDLVLYGTGPKTAKTSTHVDIVIEVFPDRLRVIGGDVKNRVVERSVPRKGIYGWVDA